MTTTTIGSVELRDTIARYTQDYVQWSGEVTPLEGSLINPNEDIAIRLTATNDPYSGSSGADHVGVRLVNVRWHLRSTNGTVSIYVPTAPLDARRGPTTRRC